MSILFGMVFAFLVPLFPTIKALAVGAVGAIGYGLALYVVNFLVLGNLDLRVVRVRRWRTGPDLRADRPSGGVRRSADPLLRGKVKRRTA
jgi:hypothetical protein